MGRALWNTGGRAVPQRLTLREGNQNLEPNRVRIYSGSHPDLLRVYGTRPDLAGMEGTLCLRRDGT